MARSLRPRDVFGAPAGRHAVAVAEPPAESTRARRRPPRWLIGLAALLTLAVGGALASTPSRTDPLTGQPVALDVVSQDQAVVALQLYAAEAALVDDLRSRGPIYAPPGPDETARTARQRTAELITALQRARSFAEADPLASTYWQHPGHDELISRGQQSTQWASELALLGAVHDSVFAGSGAIAPISAQQQLTSAFGARDDPRGRWAFALLDAIDGRDTQILAGELRATEEAAWAAHVQGLAIAAEPELRTYVAAMPTPLLDVLDGHPVAAPAMARLLRR